MDSSHVFDSKECPESTNFNMLRILCHDSPVITSLLWMSVITMLHSQIPIYVISRMRFYGATQWQILVTAKGVPLFSKRREGAIPEHAD